jgi:trimethylamine:corrinoid methyltransferase-like protein
MNSGDCTLLIDGEAVFALDRETGERRPGTVKDWLEATRLIDALDEVGMYWAMIEAHDRGDTMADYVAYLGASLAISPSTCRTGRQAWSKRPGFWR